MTAGAPGGSPPRLTRKARLKWDRHAQATFVLLPEKALRVNETGAEILRRLDGTATLEAIADALLAAAPGAEADAVRRDARAFVAAMRARGVVEGGNDDDGG